MQLNLLDIVICPTCSQALYAVPFETRKFEPIFKHYCKTWCSAKHIERSTSQKKDAPPLLPPATSLGFLNSHEVTKEDCLLCHRTEIEHGALYCSGCHRYFPIIDAIPEVLPDVLRDFQKDKNFFSRFEVEFDISTFEKNRSSDSTTFEEKKDANWKYKKAEMKLTEREDLPDGFFGPGYVVPFEPLHPIRTTEKILRFMISIHHLNLRYGDYVLDLGVGYAWTTEWLLKMGYNVIGVDINRKYLQVGMERTHKKLPPLLIADMEDLPIRKDVFHGMVFYDSFHHLNNREKCLTTLSDMVKPGGLMILAEPGAKHETQPNAVQVSETYGILEKGITKSELKNLAKNTSFESVKKFPYHYGDVELLLLKKEGTRLFDSKSPDFLHAQIRTKNKDLKVKNGKSFQVPLTIDNTGNTLWLKKTEDDIGMVRIGFQLKNKDKVLINENFHRENIPADIPPGKDFELKAKLPSIDSPGDYFLEVDMVSEGIIWFKDLYYNPLVILLKIK